MKQTHRLYKISLLAFAVLGFLTGCSSEPTSTSTIEVSSDGTATISQDNIAVSISNAELNAKRIQHYEVLDSNVTFTQTINGHHFEVRDGNVTYNGKEIARPEGSTLKIKHEGSSIFTYVDDKLVQEVRIDE
jgi:hypothetical protein